MTTKTINERQFLDISAKTIADYVNMRPEAVLILDDLTIISAMIAKNIFDEKKKGGNIYEFRNRND